ncbi:MAG: immunity 49 family protein [Haemophilus haemolyticus]|nr:immunity 49 family protein [Haemophilus haemolyticus]
MEKYNIFLGSDIANTYDDAKKFTLDRVEEYVEFDNKKLKLVLSHIEEFNGNVFSLIDYLNDFHRALASKHLLENDISGFKENASIAGFLGILSEYDFQWAYNGFNTNFFFMSLLSDNQKLIDYLIKHRDEIVDISVPYKRTDTSPFFNANTLLALSGDWQLLKERALTFLNDEKKVRSDLKRIPDHEFYVALADKNIKGMQEALDKLLELKFAKRAAKGTLLHFDFYLQPQVLMYTKIAAIHGFDLGIDSPIAPKELIDINPLAEYKTPYEFMKSFDFDAPHQVWVNYVKQRMEEAEQKKVENKKGFWASLFGR